MGQHHAERSVRIGQVWTDYQGALGFGLSPLIIAARVERDSKAGAGFCIATIERDGAPCQCFFRAYRFREIARMKHSAARLMAAASPVYPPTKIGSRSMAR